jgi:type VI secretion system protein ImpF
MPPPQQPIRGVQPSILDRLIDPESAGSSIITGYSVSQMYDAVMRDLENLLNSTHAFGQLPAEFPETRNSIVLFGLPDLASIEAISTEQRAAIGTVIKKSVERFEPRLRNVRVSMLKAEANVVNRSVQFRIDARLAVDPAPDVAFDTILDMGTGAYLVAKATPAE